jgi:hypothetical protein
VAFIARWQCRFSDLSPAVRPPKLDRTVVVVGDVEHEMQSKFGSPAPGSVHQLRGDLLSPVARSHKEPAHHRDMREGHLERLLPLRPCSVWIGPRQREVTNGLAAVLKHPGRDRAQAGQPPTRVGRPVRRITVCAVNRPQEDDQTLKVLVAARTNHGPNVLQAAGIGEWRGGSGQDGLAAQFLCASGSRAELLQSRRRDARRTICDPPTS